jgi:hypothetical protein
MKKVSLSIPTLAILSACIALAITPAWADDLTVFSNGSVADANDVNANFTELETRIDTISLTPGEAGVAGAQGVQGNQGFIGVTGATGAQGLPGNTGATGSMGLNGTNGTNGAKGSQGAIGAAGGQGIQGLAGATGAAGINGNTGAKGEVGNTGVDGATGAQGVIGDAGAKGEAGIDGIDGIDGRNASVEEINEIKDRISEGETESNINVTAISNIMEDVLDIEQIADIDRDNSFNNIMDIRLQGAINEASIDNMSFKIFNNENNIQNNSNDRVVGEVEGNLQYWDGMTWRMIAPPILDTEVKQVLRHDIDGYKWVIEQRNVGCRVWNDLGINRIYAELIGTFTPFIDTGIDEGSEFIIFNYIKDFGNGNTTYTYQMRRNNKTLLFSTHVRAWDSGGTMEYRNESVFALDPTDSSGIEMSQEEFDHCFAVLMRAIANRKDFSS